MRFILILASALWLAACTQPAATSNTSEASCSISTAEEGCARPATAEADVGAKPAGEYVEGRDYRVLEQPIAGAPDVIELFFYGCRACYYLTDDLADWSSDKKVGFSLVPAHTDTNLVESARMFHTFGVLGRLDLHVDGYVLFQEPSELQGEERINALLAERGVNKDEFWAAWGSEAVNQRLAGSYQLTERAGVSSTPAFIVQGKYVVELGVIEGSEGVLNLLEFLVKKGA